MSARIEDRHRKAVARMMATADKVLPGVTQICAQALADCERETVERCAAYVETAAGAPGGLIRGECKSMARAMRRGEWKQGDGETP